MNPEIFSKESFLKLADVHSDYCASIYIPTHRSGDEVLQGKDRILFKNQIQELNDKLEEQGMPPRDREAFLESARGLLDDNYFWKNQSDGLAVFITDDLFEHYEMPIRFETYNYLANNFYLKPMTPYFVGNGNFYLLALELEGVNLYEGSRHSITQIDISDLVPSGIKEVVGTDYEQASLQFRTGQEGQGHATFHGHGEGKDDHKIEVKKYLQAVNSGLMKYLNDKKVPLILASQDYIYGIYKDINSYGPLYEKYIPGSPGNEGLLLLHEKAWDLVKPYYDKERKEKMEQCVALHDTDRTSAEIENIIPAVLSGKVDTLFIENRSDVWGLYDPSDGKVEVHDEDKFSNVSLLDMAAQETIRRGGKVFLLEKENMPFDFSQINALYRYE